MFNSGVIFTRLKASVRPPVALFGVHYVQANFLSRVPVRNSLDLASVLRTVSKRAQKYTRCSPQIFAFSSHIKPDSNSSEKQESCLKRDACTIQAAQEFANIDTDNNRDHLQIQESTTVYHSSKVGYRSESEVIKSDTKSSTDFEIEEFGYHECDEEEIEEDMPERHIPISLDRGQHGVFDVEEVVTLLEHENGMDIQVIDIPPEVRFVDKMVIVSGKSLRHMRAMAASVEWLYKRKRKQGDRQFKLEGRESKDWLAVDMGNIAVHIFTPEARQHYDLETLWTLGPEYDDQRHYMEGDQLNLSAADLFWLETGLTEGQGMCGVEDVKEKISNGHLYDEHGSEGTQKAVGSSRVQPASRTDLSQSNMD